VGRGAPKNSVAWDLSIFNFAGRDKAPDPFAAVEPPPVDTTFDDGRDIRDVLAEILPPAVEGEETDGPDADPEPEPEPLAEPEPAQFDPDAFRTAMARAATVDFDPGGFRDLMQSLAGDAPAPPAGPPQPVYLGPPLPIPEALLADPEPSPWDLIRHAVALAANDAPAPRQPHTTENPATEPGFLFDATAFRAALRRATSE
jgi:hypothetical protein